MSEREDTPSEIKEAAQLLVKDLLPTKSGVIYKQCYDQFVAWQEKYHTTSVTEETMLVYFNELSKTFKPTSVWAKFSMLKSTIRNFRQVDIGNYNQLLALLKKNSKGFTSTKSKILQPEDVERFLTEAPDNRYLAVKVALILGITGACRREELKNITIHDIEHHNNMAVVKIPRTKNDVARKFTVDGDFYELFKKYEALRPEKPVSDQFFLCLRDGKCTHQVIGINTFGAMPKTIAEFLKLPEPEKYTGHSFRRTSATMLADAGADLMTLKRHGGWKSDKVAMGYVEDSINNKKKICRQICSSVNLNRHKPTASETTPRTPEKNKPTDMIDDTYPPKNSEASVDGKENSTDFGRVAPGKNVSMQLHNCNVTFNFTKE